MITCVDKHLLMAGDANIQHYIRSDIEFIQLSGSKLEFDLLNSLFSAKYLDWGAQVNAFIQYYRQQWFVKLPSWYEGFCELKGIN